MIFSETKLKGAYIIEPDWHEDARGSFARVFCQQEFIAHGLNPIVAQANIASNLKRGTLRGIHYQFPPKAEAKYVRCTRGAIFDVLVDLRPESPSYLQHIGVELLAHNQLGLYVPERFGHGYITLVDDTEKSYLMSTHYVPSLQGGLMYDDPRLALRWPIPIETISEKDTQWRLLDEIEDDLIRRMTIMEIVDA
jgi:dTDP-4-dehydrorhamnose 3,5-epimerase